MKKYILKGAATLVLGGCMVGCSHDDIDYSSIVESKLLAYQEVFVDAYGTIDPNQNWGFNQDATNGSRAMTRAMMRKEAQMPELPTFRDSNPISRPVVPEYSNTVPAGAHYAKDYQEYQTGDMLYINSEYATLIDPQNTENLTIYADGVVTYAGGTCQNGNGTTICVTQGSTLSLTEVSNNLTIYLAPGATLNLPEDATFQNPNAALYMSSGSRVNATNLTFTNNTKILNAGGTITATNLTLDQGNSLWNEGTITVANALTCENTGDVIYNAQGQTITAGRFDLINNDALLYNDGIATATGEIKLHNSEAEIVNNGTLSGAILNMAAGGKMHNVGTTTIDGKTDLTNSNSKWVNDGQYTSGSFDVDNYSVQNFNNCRLTVKGNFHLNRGEFVLNADASVVCESFSWEDTSNFWLNSRSMLKVNGTLLTNNANSDYGFRGVGIDYAVIKANAITIESNEQFRMSYFGKLYVDANSHFGQWYKDGPSNINQPCYYYDSTVKFSFTDPADEGVIESTAPVSIPSSDCSPGYSGKAETIVIPIDQGSETEDRITIETTCDTLKITELIEQGRVFCEDLGKISTNDLDFNDVVFDAYVYRITTGVHTVVKEDGIEVSNDTIFNEPTYKTTIVLLAAGGTLALTVAGDYEVHNVLGGNPSSTIINTIDGAEGSYGNAWVTHDPVVLGTEFNYSSIVEIPIRVQYGNGDVLELKAEQGWAPHKILVPIGTKWCKERVDIATAYTNFLNYVEHSDDCWSDNFVEENLYTHPKDTYKPIVFDPLTVITGTWGPTITYRSAGTSTQTGGYDNEEVLSRKKIIFND